MADKETLKNIFAAYVNQSTLEEAAAWMVEVTRSHPGLAQEFVNVLSQAASASDSLVIEAVNSSGYQVSTAKEARAYCAELLSIYENLRKAS